MKNKKIAMIGLAAVMAVAAMSASAFAEEMSSGDMPTCNMHESDDRAYYPVPQTALSGIGSCIKYFSTTVSAKYLKVWVINNSHESGTPEDYEVRLYQGTTLIDQCTVGGGYEWNGSWYDNDNGIVTDKSNAAAASYRVVVSNSTGNQLKGYITVRRGSYPMRVR